MTTPTPPRLIPTGFCWCGCGKQTTIGAFFARGHDKIAEAALTAAEFHGSVPQLLHHHGYDDRRSVITQAVTDGPWEKCADCWYCGTPESVRSHRRKYPDHTTPS